jgi:hypothetical protein
VEAAMRADGVSPAGRECHDAQPGRYRVDFVYADATPRPFALEITALVAGGDRAGAAAADHLTTRLSQLARDEKLGAWLVVVRTDSASLRELEPEIAKVLRDAQPIRERLLATDDQIRPGHYLAGDLLRLPNDRARAAFAAEHKRLKEMGLEELKPVHPIPGRGEHGVGVLPLSGWREIGSFSHHLQEAVDTNAQKLGEAAGLEGHLAILVDRFDASTYPELTEVPSLPPEVEVLWVVHRWEHGLNFRAVWSARRGETSWRVYELD